MSNTEFKVIKKHTLGGRYSALPRFRDTPAGQEIKDKFESYRSKGKVTSKEIYEVVDGNIIVMVESIWHDKEAYKEFEYWYHENYAKKVEEYDRNNQMSLEYRVYNEQGNLFANGAKEAIESLFKR